MISYHIILYLHVFAVYQALVALDFIVTPSVARLACSWTSAMTSATPNAVMDLPAQWRRTGRSRCTTPLCLTSTTQEYIYIYTCVCDRP